MGKQLDITLKKVSGKFSESAGYRARGGKEGAKTQLHRARVYFDTWIESHPDYKDDFSKLLWGKV